MNTLKLISYPFLELLFFLAGLYFIEINIFTGAALIFISSVFLNFSLHISVHYHVHFKASNKMVDSLLDIVSSLLMGIPFHYYQMSHWNHHRYDNTLGDFTCTWKLKNDVLVSKNFFFYSFFWPFASNIRAGKQKEQAKKEGYFDDKKERKMKKEGLAILMLIGFLFYLDTMYGLSYLFLVYSGWTMVSMHNYGQHLPEKYGELKANSYYNRFYNALFFNNGLHIEHHHKPGLKYWELQPEFKGKIKHPHLLEGLFFSSKIKNQEND